MIDETAILLLRRRSSRLRCPTQALSDECSCCPKIPQCAFEFLLQTYVGGGQMLSRAAAYVGHVWSMGSAVCCPMLQGHSPVCSMPNFVCRWWFRRDEYEKSYRLQWNGLRHAYIYREREGGGGGGCSMNTAVEKRQRLAYERFLFGQDKTSVQSLDNSCIFTKATNGPTVK